MMRFRLFAALLVLCMVLCLGASAETVAVTTDGRQAIVLGETDTGRVSGVLLDSTGACVSGARVSFADAQGTEAASALTDSSGRWTALSLKAGTYTVSARSDDQVILSGRHVTVQAGQELALRCSAQSGTASVTVCVFADRNKNGEMGSSESVLSGALV